MQLFVNKSELLPNGETTEQHIKWSKEEAELVQQDKDNPSNRNGGLFKGCFRVILNPNQDLSDNVRRCPFCNWEVVDNVCEGCGVDFDGQNADDSFGGFSEMDSMSEHDISSEDVDGDLDMDDYDGEHGYHPPYDDEEGDFLDDDALFPGQSFVLNRWFANGRRVPQPYGGGVSRRRAAHSAAGSRRSYAASLVSGMHTEDTDMGILEEEEEEDEDDSSMVDFIVDDEASEAGSQATTSTPEPRLQPHLRSAQRRNRRVVESETSSASQTTEEDEDDGPPVPPGRRRLQNRAQSQAGRRYRSPSGSSNAARSSIGMETEEDLEALLLNQGWSPLDQGSNDEDVDEEGEESDGQRTTVGWEPITNSIERSRTGGSLTPTAGRSNPPIRPPTRVRNRLPDGSRGVRHRSSVMSISTVNYEDGEADDDASDTDRDGDVNMGSSSLRPRSSRVRLRMGSNAPTANRLDSRNHANSEAEIDGDDSSDSSSRLASGRLRARRRDQEYDPRISWMFAQHMTDMRQMHQLSPQVEGNALFDYLEQLRGATPIARPRTANRNRPPSRNGVTGAMANPINLPAQGIVPSNHAPSRNAHTPISPSSDPPLRSPSRTASTPHRPPPISNSNMYPTVASNRDAGTALTVNGISTLRTNRDPSTTFSPSISQHSSPIQTRPEIRTSIALPASEDLIERPPSRLPSRPPSAAGRRGSGAFTMPYPNATASLGLNFAARQFQAQNNNPFFRPRPRQSTQRLREQSSTATLRPRSSQRILRTHPSQVNVRETASHAPDPPPSGVRVRVSRNNLRSMPSQQRIHAQASSRNLRSAGPLTAAHINPGAQAGALASSRLSTASTSSHLTEDERRRRANELIRRRQQELNTNSLNPFAGGRRQSNQLATNSRDIAAAQPEQPSTTTAQGTSLPHSTTPPNLNRRRSARNMGGAQVALAPA